MCYPWGAGRKCWCHTCSPHVCTGTSPPGILWTLTPRCSCRLNYLHPSGLPWPLLLCSTHCSAAAEGAFLHKPDTSPFSLRHCGVFLEPLEGTQVIRPHLSASPLAPSAPALLTSFLCQASWFSLTPGPLHRLSPGLDSFLCSLPGCFLLTLQVPSAPTLRRPGYFVILRVLHGRNCSLWLGQCFSNFLEWGMIFSKFLAPCTPLRWKDWHWSWNSNTLATWFKELTYWKRPWCWERLKAGGEGDNRGWDGWMASPTQWTWVWVGSGSRWLTGRPGMLWSMESQRVTQTQLSNWTELNL